MSSYQIIEYLDDRGRSPFRRWFEALDPVAAARVAVALYRMEQGNVSNVRSLGGALGEYRMDFGPGYLPPVLRPAGPALAAAPRRRHQADPATGH
jgi:hypothetical protein